MPTTRTVSALPTGTAFSRYLIARGVADAAAGLELAAGWRDTPTVLATLEAELTYTKAATAPGTTTDAAWAAPLAQFGIANEALAALRFASVVGLLESRMRRVPPRTSVPRETGTGTGGAWIGENAATPVVATAFDTVAQSLYKIGVIIVLSDELRTVSHLDAEREVRSAVIAGLATFLDQQFLDPSVSLIPGLRPASITNGAVAVTSTGTLSLQMNADLAQLLASITTPGAGLTWVMRPQTAARIAATIGGTAAADVPRTLFGLPMIVSATSPQQVTLIDASQILYSDDGAIEFSASRQAAIEMNTTPTSPAVAATTMVSLYQLNLWGLRAVKWLAYLRARDGAVAYMVTAY